MFKGMTILSFKSKRDKEKLYEKARKMEEYASMIVDCLEEAGYDGYDEDYKRSYKGHDEDEEHLERGRYSYRNVMR